MDQVFQDLEATRRQGDGAVVCLGLMDHRFENRYYNFVLPHEGDGTHEAEIEEVQQRLLPPRKRDLEERVWQPITSNS